MERAKALINTYDQPPDGTNLLSKSEIINGLRQRCIINQLSNIKAHEPKNRPRNFFCFAINSLFIINSYLSLKRKNESIEPKPIKAGIREIHTTSSKS